MLALSILLLVDAQTVFKKCESAIYTINTSEKTGTGFAIRDGKFLITCDHVISGCSKIDIVASKQPDRHGYLVYSDPSLDIALFRLDKPSPKFLKFVTKKVNPGSQIYVIGTSLGVLEKSIFQGIVSGIRRDGDKAEIQFDAAISSGNSGSPILNADGDIIGMAQSTLTRGQNLNFGLSSFNIEKFLLTRSRTKQGRALGHLGQALESANIYAAPADNAVVYYLTKEYQYLIVNNYDDTYFKVLMSNGIDGYIKKSQAVMLDQIVHASISGIASAKDIVREATEFDESLLRETSTASAWLNECAVFVAKVFKSAGREISSEVEIQLDIGSPVNGIEGLSTGDRIYFQGPRVAIYLGDGRYISVTKQGKLVVSPLDDEARKQFLTARH